MEAVEHRRRRLWREWRSIASQLCTQHNADVHGGRILLKDAGDHNGNFDKTRSADSRILDQLLCVWGGAGAAALLRGTDDLSSRKRRQCTQGSRSGRRHQGPGAVLRLAGHHDQAVLPSQVWPLDSGLGSMAPLAKCLQVGLLAAAACPLGLDVVHVKMIAQRRLAAGASSALAAKALHALPLSHLGRPFPQQN